MFPARRLHVTRLRRGVARAACDRVAERGREGRRARDCGACPVVRAEPPGKLQLARDLQGAATRTTATGPRDLGRIHQAVSPPAHREQPGMWGGYRGRMPPGWGLGLPLPAVEPTSRGGFVKAHRRRSSAVLLPVLAGVQQNVGQSIPDFARRSQDSQVVPPMEDAPRTAEHTVRRPGKPRRDCLHPPPEGLPSRGFHEQVNVIALHRVVHDAKHAPLARLAEASPEGLQKTSAPQRGQLAAYAKGYVRRAVSRNARSSHVMDRRPLR